MSIKDSFLKKKAVKTFTDESQMSYEFKNELGSIMTIEFPNGGGLVTGTYKSGVNDTTTYPLTGFVSSNIITFTVSFTNDGSISAWAGQAIWNASTSVWEIHTLWHLVEPTSPSDMWESTLAGSDIFTQIT
ncbi:avidin/streptavidin family protein [Sulfurimonas sp. CS5]|uniref:avidin/streptavidin family protein n=1 Tax=Sulfurimonas sp. CS5 TaxID=3391145 RepID=UPI0039E80BFB